MTKRAGSPTAKRGETHFASRQQQVQAAAGFPVIILSPAGRLLSGVPLPIHLDNRTIAIIVRRGLGRSHGVACSPYDLSPRRRIDLSLPMKLTRDEFEKLALEHLDMLFRIARRTTRDTASAED